MERYASYGRPGGLRLSRPADWTLHADEEIGGEEVLITINDGFRLAHALLDPGQVEQLHAWLGQRLDGAART